MSRPLPVGQPRCCRAIASALLNFWKWWVKGELGLWSISEEMLEVYKQMVLAFRKLSKNKPHRLPTAVNFPNCRSVCIQIIFICFLVNSTLPRWQNCFVLPFRTQKALINHAKPGTDLAPKCPLQESELITSALGTAVLCWGLKRFLWARNSSNKMEMRTN